MATYNGEQFIKEQIDSILPQLGDEDELVVSDDGSRDATLSMLQAYDDSRIRILINEGKHGFVWNFENALRSAKGDVIFLCDQDDYWFPNKVEVALKELGDCDLLVHDAEIVDGEGKPRGCSYYETNHRRTDFLSNFWKSRFIGCCMVFRRSVLQASLPFPKTTVGHDYWIGMYASSRFKVKFIPDKLMAYRRHGRNASPSSEKSNTTLYFKFVKKRFPLLFSVIGRRLKDITHSSSC